MNQFFKRIVISLAAVFAGVMAFAQVTTSSISGKVSDANGALPGVTILALHEPTGTQYYAITDEKGFYRLNNIQAGGPYKMTVSCLGYTEMKRIAALLGCKLICLNHCVYI